MIYVIVTQFIFCELLAVKRKEYLNFSLNINSSYI